MLQDHKLLTLDQLELLEKQTLRVVVQAMQEYSAEARDIFETTAATSSKEVIVLAEDLVQNALEVAVVYSINNRFAGFIDYKRVRWLPTVYGLIPQVLLVDAKASTEPNRTTLQQSQLPMDADFLKGKGASAAPVSLKAWVPEEHPVPMVSGGSLAAVTSTLVVHFHYTNVSPSPGRVRTLHAIHICSVPHQRLKARYNPTPADSFFGEGKHSTRLSSFRRRRALRVTGWARFDVQWSRGVLVRSIRGGSDRGVARRACRCS